MAGIVKVYYGKPMLPDVSRVLACLYEKDVEFKLIEMHEGQHMPPDILKIQASARVPVPGFEDGSTTLFESRTICRYISEKYAKQGNKYLLGRDLLERASIEQWLKSEEQSFDPPSWALVFHLAFAPLMRLVEPDRTLIEQNERKLAEVLDVYEQRLSESMFLAGNEFTLADLSHLPNSHYIANSDQWGYLFHSRKNIKRWWKKISNRASWRKVVQILDGVDILKVNTDAERSTTPNGSSEVQEIISTKPVIKYSHLHGPFQPITVTTSLPETASTTSATASPQPPSASEPTLKPALSKQDTKPPSITPSTGQTAPTTPLGSQPEPITEPTKQSEQTPASQSITQPNSGKSKLVSGNQTGHPTDQPNTQAAAMKAQLTVKPPSTAEPEPQPASSNARSTARPDLTTKPTSQPVKESPATQTTAQPQLTTTSAGQQLQANFNQLTSKTEVETQPNSQKTTAAPVPSIPKPEQIPQSSAHPAQATQVQFSPSTDDKTEAARPVPASTQQDVKTPTTSQEAQATRTALPPPEQETTIGPTSQPAQEPCAVQSTQSSSSQASVKQPAPSTQLKATTADIPPQVTSQLHDATQSATLQTTEKASNALQPSDVQSTTQAIQTAAKAPSESAQPTPAESRTRDVPATQSTNQQVQKAPTAKKNGLPDITKSTTQTAIGTETAPEQEQQAKLTAAPQPTKEPATPAQPDPQKEPRGQSNLAPSPNSKTSPQQDSDSKNTT